MLAKELGNAGRVSLISGRREALTLGTLMKGIKMTKKNSALFLLCALVSYSSLSSAHELKTKGSIPLTDNKTFLPDLAKIGINDAITAATREASGKVVEAFLENEHGFLTYRVVVSNTDKTVTDVSVDAGNGQILYRATESVTDDCGKDKNDAQEH